MKTHNNQGSGSMSESTEDARRARLPKWARQRLTVLERSLEFAHARLGEGPEDADTLVVGFSTPSRPLGKGSTIRFLTGPGPSYVEASVRDGEVSIRSGEGYLLIRPEVSNVVRVSVNPR